MHEQHLLEILALGFGLALISGSLAHRLGLSPIMGYLLAGFVMGPHCLPGIRADAGLARQLSEAGVILLMFGVGLRFRFSDLMAVKGISLPGALAQSVVVAGCGTTLALACGMPVGAGFILGFGLAAVSAVALLRAFGDADALNSAPGHIAVGWLVALEELTVFILVLLPSLAGLDRGDAGEAGFLRLAGALGQTFARLVLLWLLVLALGRKIVPGLIRLVLRTRSHELLVLVSLTAAFTTAVGAARFFGASMALGAFLGGMVVGRSEASRQAGANVLPLRDAFAVLFFVAVGMLFDPAYLIKAPWLVAGCLFIVLVVKPLAGMALVAARGYSAAAGIAVAFGLAQVGEFSFILAHQAADLKLLPDDSVYNALVFSAFVSIGVNPFLFRRIPGALKALERRPRLWRLVNGPAGAWTPIAMPDGAPQQPVEKD